ncbi:MAG: prolipoprotein diacylglyceryl transferase [Candidatus Veblenbacteria bacterium]|nr:prolipoprotein diacylglyceryl transferase [Candidatus Veblenbacteria bacterium]MDZ4229758.1 prolipoprotein diacylglyceryl transferase [Candidatus Veblenbacteria bacterium]
MFELLHSHIPDAVLFSLGPFAIRWYGLLLVLGVAAGYALTRRRWRELGWPVAQLEGLVVWLVVAGLLGARLVDVFAYEWWYFRDHLGEIFYLWRGGLAWHGGLVGGAVALVWWARRHRWSLFELLDSLAPGLAVGQAVGRWGNYFNQELFGLPTSLPWGIPIAGAYRPQAYLDAVYFHPVFLYEFLALVLLAGALWRWRAKLVAGRLFALYLILSGILRFALEFLRVDEQTLIWGARTGFIVALLAIAVGLAVQWKAPRTKTAP